MIIEIFKAVSEILEQTPVESTRAKNKRNIQVFLAKVLYN